jgi:hypothetical protein
MTTIAQLPPAGSVGPSDLLLLSQAGVLYSVSVALLNAPLQPLLSVPSGMLLGRQSLGAGGPESISLGLGVSLSGGALAADGADHAAFPLQSAMSLSDDIVINQSGAPGLLPVAALRGLFSAGAGVAIDPDGVISALAVGSVGPAGATGAAGPAGPAGPAGAIGATGAGLGGPAGANSANSVGASDYVALWQNGALAWMPYGQFIGGETIDQLPAAGPALDADLLMVAQGGNALSVQGFGAIWSYVQGKLPQFRRGVVELTGNTVLDATAHNDRILVASAPLTLSANFANTGAGFGCTLINLAPGLVTLGSGISSGSGSTGLPPGAAASLVGISYSGGSTVWWSGVVPNAPTLTVGAVVAPPPATPFIISGGVFNDAPVALDYSSDGGATWAAAADPVITANAFSFTAAGLAPGTYAIRVRDHANTAILGISNGFTVVAPSIGVATLPATMALAGLLTVTGTVSPPGAAVQVGLSTSTTTAPANWVSAGVNGGGWTATLTPAVAGTAYVWAQQVGAQSVEAVSGAVTVVAATLSVVAPANATAGNGVVVTGTVSPAADAVNVQLANQNTVAPSGGWTAAANAGGSFTVTLTPGTGGTYFAWAQDAVSGLTAVSSAMLVAAAPGVSYGVNNPGQSYVHGVSTIGLNGAITPAQNVATQVALSTSNTTVPTSGWQAASIVYANALWAVYAPTPASPGSYYVWVQTAAGASTTVSGFSILVT